MTVFINVRHAAGTEDLKMDSLVIILQYYELFYSAAIILNQSSKNQMCLYQIFNG